MKDPRMKQLNFGCFNIINSKKFTVTVNFFQNEPKTPMLTLFTISRSFGHFLAISDYFKRFPKTTDNYRKFPETTEDVRSLPKISEEKSENSAVFTGERYIFSVQTRFFHQKPSKHWTEFSPETVSMKIMANYQQPLKLLVNNTKH